jgi:CheY-like chemotaxis protein
LTARKTALVVDDDDVSKTLAERQLTELGLQCDFASDGEEALDAVRVTDYDLILMDVMMPGMNGLEATSHIRELELRQGKKRVPIIAMTAIGDEDDALRAGMDDFLRKPVMRDELHAVVAKWLPSQLSSRGREGTRREA